MASGAKSVGCRKFSSDIVPVASKLYDEEAGDRKPLSTKKISTPRTPPGIEKQWTISTIVTGDSPAIRQERGCTSLSDVLQS